MYDYPMSLISLYTWSIFFGWMSQGFHSEQLLFFALFYQSTPSCLKVMGGMVVGGPCDFSVSPTPFSLDFGTLDTGWTISHIRIVKSKVLLSGIEWRWTLVND